MKNDLEADRQFDEFFSVHKLQGTAYRTVISYLLMEPARPARESVRRSHGWAKDTCKPVEPLSTYRHAILDMKNRDLVWVIDDVKRSQIIDHLGASPALGPTDGIPPIGTLQISIRLAKLYDELWQQLGSQRPAVTWACDYPSSNLQLVYSTKRSHLVDFAREELSNIESYPNIVNVSEPTACGPWRCQWWRLYESGYVTTVNYS